MNEMFSQGGKGSTGILTNKQAVARHFGVKQSEVVYFSVGALLTGYKVIYDKVSQRAYSLPADIGSGVTAISLSPAGVLVHSAGSVDLGALAVSREEYVTLPGSFDTGVTVNTKNELVVFTDGKYRWDGALPKEVPAGSTSENSGGVGIGAWLGVGDAVLRGNLRSDVDGMGDALIAVKQPVSGAIARTQHDKNAELVTGGDLGETPTRNLFSTENNTALGAYSFKSFSFNAVYNCFVGAHAGESIVGSESDIAIGAENTGVGHGAGRRITTGKRNITVGAEAGSLITTGSFNIVIGAQSSSASGEKTGDLNTICGYNAGKNWTTAIRNSFYGSDAGSATTTGNDNAAFGQAAMQNNTTGGGNTYLGAFAGTETGTGGNNLAAGRSALFRNIDGSRNVALGREAAMGVSGSGASPNNITVMGFQAGWSQNGLTGVVFCGMQAGYRATTMADTVLLGRAAGFNLTTGSNNVMVGAATGDSETTGTQLVYLGHGAGRFLIDGSAATGKLNCVAIGYQARVGGNHEIQMGNSSQTVYVYGTVQTRSDERDKADVRDIPADVAVAFVRGLRSCMYKFDYRDDYIEEYIEEVGTDAEGKPVYETKIRHLDKDGSKKRTREHAGYLAQQVKELLDKLGFDCGIYQDHLVNEGGCDVKTLAYEQTIPFITKALDVAFTKLDDIENRLSAIEKSKEN